MLPSRVSMTVHVFSVVFSSIWKNRLTSQKPESLTCESTVAPPAMAMTISARSTDESPSVASTTGAISPAAAAADLGQFQLTLLVMAIAAGATVLSHVNDSGFWLVSRFFGMDEKTTLKTWTVMETTLGLTAFVISLALWAVA